MTKHVISKDQNAELKIATSNDIWVVSEDTDITKVGEVNDQTVYGISEDEISIGNDIIVNGSVSAYGKMSYAIASEGVDSIIRIGATGELSAIVGMAVYGAGAKISNFGDIDAITKGISAEKAVSIVNGGEINAYSGIIAGFDGVNITNKAGGLITGAVGIQTNGDHSTIRNAGTIQGVFAATSDGNGELKLFNSGTVVGDILMGGGNDRFTSTGGHVIGVVKGGDGNDTYVVDNASIYAWEDDNKGKDTVLTSASYNLLGDGGSIEVLRATGTKNINLSGNNDDTRLVGNAGNNRIDGGDGVDHLVGRGGNDRLTGGSGDDSFDFANHSGKDVVLDFIQGEDVVDLTAYSGMTFAEVIAHTADITAGTMITLLDGDTILLKDVHGITLTTSDVLI